MCLFYVLVGFVIFWCQICVVLIKILKISTLSLSLNEISMKSQNSQNPKNGQTKRRHAGDFGKNDGYDEDMMMMMLLA